MTVQELAHFALSGIVESEARFSPQHLQERIVALLAALGPMKAKEIGFALGFGHDAKYSCLAGHEVYETLGALLSSGRVSTDPVTCTFAVAGEMRS